MPSPRLVAAAAAAEAPKGTDLFSELKRSVARVSSWSLPRPLHLLADEIGERTAGFANRFLHGVRSLLPRLQGMHVVWRLSSVVCPPLACGMRWSISSTTPGVAEGLAPQRT